MLKIFEQYCDIYDICKNENDLGNYKLIGKYLSGNNKNKIKTFHRHGYFFYFFDKLVNKEISLEDFFLLGDITSNSNILKYQKENQPNIYSMETIYQKLQNGTVKNTVFIIDNRGYNWFMNNYQGEKHVFDKLIEKHNCEFFVA